MQLRATLLSRALGLAYFITQAESSNPRRSLAILGRIGHSFIFFIFAFLLTIDLLLIFTVMCVIGKKKRGRLVEWDEKASFDRLN